MNPTDAPQRITVISRAPLRADPIELERVAIYLDGQSVDWADAPVQEIGDILEVNGLPYRMECRLEDRAHEGWWYFSHAYHLQVGWRIFLEYETDKGPQMIPSPSQPHPVASFEEAAADARKTVTHYLTVHRSHLVTEIRWQHGDEFGEPVAGLDGRNYTRTQAANAFLSGEWLPFDWQKDEAEDAPTSPAPDTSGSSSPSSEEQEPTRSDDSTEPGSRQVIALTVRYQGTGQAVIPTGTRAGATCELVDYADGRNDRPPDKNVARLRLWLKEIGFEPSFHEWKWLDRGHGPRRRFEVYRHTNGAGNGHNGRGIDWELFREVARENAPPGLSDAQRRTLYRQKALAGEKYFEACQDCPHLQDCPHDWRACDRKAEFSQRKQREIDRPRSSQNPVFWAYQY